MRQLGYGNHLLLILKQVGGYGTKKTKSGAMQTHRIQPLKYAVIIKKRYISRDNSWLIENT